MYSPPGHLAQIYGYPDTSLAVTCHKFLNGGNFYVVKAVPEYKKLLREVSASSNGRKAFGNVRGCVISCCSEENRLV